MKYTFLILIIFLYFTCSQTQKTNYSSTNMDYTTLKSQYDDADYNDATKLSTFAKKIGQRIFSNLSVNHRYKEYPPRGRTVIACDVGHSGNLLDYAVFCHEGNRFLKQAGLRTLKAATPFSKFPENQPAKQIVVLLSFIYPQTEYSEKFSRILLISISWLLRFI